MEVVEERLGPRVGRVTAMEVVTAWEEWGMVTVLGEEVM